MDLFSPVPARDCCPGTPSAMKFSEVEEVLTLVTFLAIALRGNVIRCSIQSGSFHDYTYTVLIESIAVKYGTIAPFQDSNNIIITPK